MKSKIKILRAAVIMLGMSVDTSAQLTGGVQEEHNIGDFTFQKNKRQNGSRFQPC